MSYTSAQVSAAIAVGSSCVIALSLPFLDFATRPTAQDREPVRQFTSEPPTEAPAVESKAS